MPRISARGSQLNDLKTSDAFQIRSKSQKTATNTDVAPETSIL